MQLAEGEVYLYNSAFIYSGISTFTHLFVYLAHVLKFMTHI